MPKNTQLYSISFSSPEFKTLGAWINDPSSPIFIYKDKPDYFLDNIVGEDSLTNRQRIHSQFKTPDTQKFINSGFNDLPIHPGLILYLEYSLVNEIGFLTEGIQVVTNDEAAFKAAKLAELESDEGYVAVTKPIGGTLGITKTSMPDLTVWIWCRALSPRLRNNEELQGQLFDLTPFIQQLTTGMNMNGGNFNITLPPLTCELNSEDTWELKRATVNQYTNNDDNLSVPHFIAESNMFQTDKDGNVGRSQFFFSNIIRENDLVFIRFDTLQMEKQQRYEDAKQYVIDKKNIAGRIYDMIGLVDNVRESLNAENNDVSINIAGRDLTKIFIEDGSYFYALENSQGILKVAGETRLKNSLVSRLYSDGVLSFLNLYSFQSIENVLKFIFQQLSNIKVIPNDLLTSYGENRNTRFNEVPTSLNNSTTGNKTFKPQFRKELANGIWQIINLIIDENITNRRIVDSSMSSASGSILNFMKSVAIEPLVQMYFDTYGDKYNVIVRKPPYDQKGYTSLIDGKVNTEDNTTSNPAIIEVSGSDVLSENLMFDPRVYSWYHFYPKGSLLNTKFDVSTHVLPAVYFDEYAQVFGSKPFQQSHSYIPYVPYSNGNNLTSIMDRQAFYDLKYVIESSQYLPFSRRGTLVLNRDRRIKVGNLIRYLPTGEVFFVDAVKHSHTVSNNGIDAYTTVEVSRGLVEQLIYGVEYQSEDGNSKHVSYFSIIDTTLTFRDKEILTDHYVQEEHGVEEIVQPAAAPASPVLLTTFDDIRGMSNNLFVNTPGKVIGVAYLEKYNAAPDNKQLFTRFVNAITASGYDVFIGPLSTNRTRAQQAALKAENPLNAAPGHSRHEIFSAIDITVGKNGKRYGKNTSEAEWRATGVPFIATSLGLQWGGKSNDGTFGNYVDRVHFEIPSNGNTTTVRKKKFKSVNRPTKTKALDSDAVFSRFKVNQFAFNFFFKGLQMDPAYRVVKNRTIKNPDGSLPEVTIIAGRK